MFIQVIKPRPKTKKENGTPETKPKQPSLKPHKHKPNNHVLFFYCSHFRNKIEATQMAH